MEVVTLVRQTRVCDGNQDPAEFAQFLDLVRTLNVRRYLEIGCRNGYTFDAVMRTIGEGGYGLAVDLPENSNTKHNLLTIINDLNRTGISSEVLFGNSRNEDIIDRIKDSGPFDLILIDADHRYDGVKRDFVVYRNLAPVIVLHDVTAPRGHMSDGFPNGVGVFWSEIKDGFRHQEFVTPGSLMGFGVLYRDMVEAVSTPTAIPPMFIEIPAWGKYYVDLACRFTIPAALAALKESNFEDVTFLVHTDNQEAFRSVIGDHKIMFLPLLPMAAPPKDERMPRLPQGYWEAFKQAHKDAIETTPQGSIVTLLNSDIIVSRECFSFVEKEFLGGKKVVVSVGIRTQIEDNAGPPIGASANELYTWIWGHRHHLTEECIWGRGRSTHPTILFFEDDDGNVSMHGWHLTPMFIRKDRALQFKGTIDDDLLARYRPDEISYITNGDVAFCEISPNWKLHPFGKPLNVRDVLAFWKSRTMRPHYLRNFKQRITVLGNPTKNHPAADQIIAGLARS